MARAPVRKRPLPADLPLLKDRIKPGVRVLFVGINPGVRSALTGHHFAGFSNRFWKLLFESGLVPEQVGYVDDDRLPAWGLGITNLVPRPTPGVSDLEPAEYVAGRAALERKIRRYRPRIVVLIGVSLARALLPSARAPLAVGMHPETLAGAPVFVLPNPSGRNAHFSYAQMLAAFTDLRRHLEQADADTGTSRV
jgi:double-stranded uracil-DNA glycosylase